MHPYLPFLLDDIAASHRKEYHDKIPCSKTFEEEMEEIKRWVEGEEYEHTFGYYCGLQAENFPPAEQLTVHEIERVNEAFKRMMRTYNLDVDFPEALPCSITYSMLTSILNEKTFIPKDGFVNFDYCSGYAPECIFKEYCSCLEYWNSDIKEDEDASMNNSENDDFPF